jgi:radical SAM protein with 4Fe4S-binding SPASM domain
MRSTLQLARKMVQTPEVLVQIGKTMLRRRIAGPLDYHFGQGHSGPFSRIDIKIVNACNLRCKMCGQWGEAGWHLNQPASFIRDLVPLDRYQALVDEVAHLSPWFSIWGGEPFLYPDLMPLLAYMKQRKLLVTLSTNGLTLEKHSAEIVEMGVDFLYVSIDGPEQVHDEVRGLPGAFRRTTAGIRAVQVEKKRTGRVKPYVVVVSAASKANAGCFDQICGITEDAGADGFLGQYGWFQTESSCMHHERVMMTKLGTFPRSHRGWLWSFSEIDAHALVESVKRIKGRDWSFPCYFLPELTEEEIPRYYREHGNSFGNDRCMTPWTVVEILANGDVATCPDFPDYVVGNITKEGILDIWNNDQYRKFRNHLKNDGLLPVCTRCCGLLGRGN